MSETTRITARQAEAVKRLIVNECGVDAVVHVENEYALGGGQLLRVSESTDFPDKGRHWVIDKDGGVIEL